MNLIDYLIHHTVALLRLMLRRLWQLHARRSYERTRTGTLRATKQDESVGGSDDRWHVIEEAGTGSPLERTKHANHDVSHERRLRPRRRRYVFEPWIVEKLNLGRYGRAPSFVTIDDITLTEPWRRIASENGEPRAGDDRPRTARRASTRSRERDRSIWRASAPFDGGHLGRATAQPVRDSPESLTRTSTSICSGRS
jgi:hypothetical protein